MADVTQDFRQVDTNNMPIRANRTKLLRDMRNLICLFAALPFLGGPFSTLNADTCPVPIIFDTDMGNDIDDVLALGVLHTLASRGECRLLAVTTTKDDPESAPFVDAVNTFYGRGEIPVGGVRGGVVGKRSRYTNLIFKCDGSCRRYPHNIVHGQCVPEAVKVLRQALATAQDASVTIVQVGFSTNLARLLRSLPDDISPLPGTDLVELKVRLLSVMAGAFVSIDDRPLREYNVKEDVVSAQHLVDHWPTPIVFSGFEIGNAIEFPGENIVRDFTYTRYHPLAEAYLLHSPPTHNRPSWDLTSVLYAVRPDGSYFTLSAPGRVEVTDDGQTRFAPSNNGSHRYLIANDEQRARVKATLIELAREPPNASLQSQ